MSNSNEVRYVGIDPSSKTGLVILDSTGQVIIEEEIKSKSKKNPQRMIEIVDEVKSYLKSNDRVIIEGFAFGAKGSAVDFQYGLGWLLRAMLYNSGFKYTEATPSQLKKFCCNRGNAKKEDLVLPLYKKWQYEHSSDNVRDAFVLARMVYSMYNPKGLQVYEVEVLKKIEKPS